jgi:hypothetical protein
VFIELARLILPETIHLAGRNIPQKVEISKQSGLRAYLDLDNQTVTMEFTNTNGKMERAYYSSHVILGCVPLMAAALDFPPINPVVDEKKPMTPAPYQEPVRAQVSTPMDHVFAGEKKKPGPKPKYQGEN